jgi:16S rRNA (guanine527-N7)-methyltransferase
MADPDLVRVLTEIQRRGAIGRTPVPDAIDHSDRFVAVVPPDARTLVDLGSGGGLPALVIAFRRRDLRVVLIERRSKRVDLLRYGVRALGLGDTVTVYDGDTLGFVAAMVDPVDVVTARSFGPPLSVLATAQPLLRPDGTVLISDPPSGPSVIPATDLRLVGFEDVGSVGGIRQFRMFHVEH